MDRSRALLENAVQYEYMRCVAESDTKPNADVYKSLQGNVSNLLILSLARTYVGDAGVVAITQLAHLMPNLLVLDLRHNGVSNAACPDLLIGCMQAHRLALLDVSGNRLITRQGGTDLLKLASRHPTLININTNGSLVSRYYESRIEGHCSRRRAAIFGETDTQHPLSTFKSNWEAVFGSQDYTDFVEARRQAAEVGSAFLLKKYNVRLEARRENDDSISPKGSVTMESSPNVAAPLAILEKQDSVGDFFGRAAQTANGSDAASIPCPPSAGPTPGLARRAARPLSSKNTDTITTLKNLQEQNAEEHVAESPQKAQSVSQSASSTSSSTSSTETSVSSSVEPQRLDECEVGGEEKPDLFDSVLDGASLFKLIAAYTPKEIEVETRFKYPGKLQYIPAVGAPDPFVMPESPAPLPPQPGLVVEVEDSCPFWSFFHSSDPDGVKERRARANPNDNLIESQRALQEKIHEANIAPPVSYLQALSELAQNTETANPTAAKPEEEEEEGESNKKEAEVVLFSPQPPEVPAGGERNAIISEASPTEQPEPTVPAEPFSPPEGVTMEDTENNQEKSDDDTPKKNTQREQTEGAAGGKEMVCSASLVPRPWAFGDGLLRGADSRCFNTSTAMAFYAVMDESTDLDTKVPSEMPSVADAKLPNAGQHEVSRGSTAESMEGTEAGVNTEWGLSTVVVPEGGDGCVMDVGKALRTHGLDINSVRAHPSGLTQGDYTSWYALENVVDLREGARLTSGSLNKTGSLLATGSYDLTAKVWNAESGDLLHTLQGHSGYVYDVIWNLPFCDRLVTASFDRTCRVWDAHSGDSLFTLVGHELEVVCVAINDASTLIASGSMDQTVMVWNALTGVQVSVLQDHTAEIVCIDFAPSNKGVALIVSGSADETVRVWNALTGECLDVFEGHHGEVSAVRFNCYGNIVLSCSADCTCRLWDVHTKKCKVLKGHSKDVSDCEFSSDGWLVASGSEDMSGRVWDALSGGCIAMMKGHASGVCCVSFNNAATELLTGSADMRCLRWRVSTGECMQAFSGHLGVVISSFSTDNSTILTISKDNTCRILRKAKPNSSLLHYSLRHVCLHPKLRAAFKRDRRVPLSLRLKLDAMEQTYLVSGPNLAEMH